MATDAAACRTMSAGARIRLVVSCEHGGNRVPRGYAALFSDHTALLASHRGWDPGALALARRIADAFGAPLHAATTTRLLVDLNRSIGHPQLFSPLTRSLSPAQRREIVAHHYRPHRDAVEGAVARCIAAGERVIHVASHSFTPVLDGVERRADVAWLYDPRRPGEAAFAGDWKRALRRRRPELQLRRNYPYHGRDDGLTAWLRKRHPDDAYVGIELEVNQRRAAQGGAPWSGLCRAIVGALAGAMACVPGGSGT